MSVGLLAVRLLYRFYVLGHLSKWFTFSQLLVVCLSLWCRPLHLLPTDWRYVFVADFEALSCQVTRLFIRCRNNEIPTISAIKYTACYKLAYFLVKRHAFRFIYCFSHSVFVCRVECRQSFIFLREGFFVFSGWAKQALLQTLVCVWA